MTGETQGVVTLPQNVRSLAVMVWDIQGYEDISTNHLLMNEGINE